MTSDPSLPADEPSEVAPPAELVRAEAELRAAAVRRWSADRTWFVFRRPHLATLAMHLEIVAVIDERLPTAATDGRHVFVNPYWLRTLSGDDGRFVLAHEVWHCALSHATRRRDRHPQRWNLAVDHEVNDLLVRDHFTLPERGVHFPDFSGFHAERVYDLLSERTSVPPREANHDVHLSPSSPLEAASGLGSAYGPISGRRDPALVTRYDPLQDAEWDRLLVTQAARLAGKLPGALQLRLERLTAPRVDWRAVLRQFLSTAASSRFAWVPPSRRHLHRGWFLPSRQRSPSLRIAVAVDTSGSTSRDWPWFVAEVRSLCQSFGRYELRLLLCDTKVRYDQWFGDEHARTTPPRALIGGGGTEFCPVFERLAPDPPPALVFFTDGIGTAPSTPPAYPVLWCLTNGARAPAEWGTAVDVGNRRRTGA